MKKTATTDVALIAFSSLVSFEAFELFENTRARVTYEWRTVFFKNFATSPLPVMKAT